ncbi:MAG: phosphatase PAP2 family protein [Micavibrio sp.]
MTVLKQALTDHKLLLMVGFGYMFAVVLLALAIGVPLFELFMALGLWSVTIALAFLSLAVILAWFLASAILEAGRSRTKFSDFLNTVSDLLDQRCQAYFASGLLTYGFVGLGVLLLINFFLSEKSLIPYLIPYHWDPFFAALDKGVHFGQYPHQWLVPLVETLKLQRLLDFSYQAWFVVIFSVSSYCLFYEKNLARRLRFLWSYLLVWMIGGTFLATIFSSVGPVYFREFYPDLVDPYSDILLYLASADGEPYRAVKIMNLLLEMHHNTVKFDVNGISAMPSMHVCIAWLIALYAWTVHKAVGVFAFIFAGLILMGSVYLGWHYAIDGYAGIILATLVWWAAGKIPSRKAFL